MTFKQAELLKVIHQYIVNEGKTPTFRELHDYSTLSRGAVEQRIVYLRKYGVVTWDQDRSNIQIVGEPEMITEQLRLCTIAQCLKTSIDHKVTIHLLLPDKEITGKVDNMEWSIRMFTINGQWEYIKEVERAEILV